MRPFIFVVALLVAVPALAVDTIWVDPVDGVDQANCGGAEGATACLTIQYAVDSGGPVDGDGLTAGDTIILTDYEGTEASIHTSATVATGLTGDCATWGNNRRVGIILDGIDCSAAACTIRSEGQTLGSARVWIASTPVYGENTRTTRAIISDETKGLSIIGIHFDSSSEVSCFDAAGSSLSIDNTIMTGDWEADDGTVFKLYDVDGLTLTDTEVYWDGKPCHTSKTWKCLAATTSQPEGYIGSPLCNTNADCFGGVLNNRCRPANSVHGQSWTRLSNGTIDNYYLGYFDSWGGPADSNNLTIKNSEFVHNAEHGISVSRSDNILWENNIFRADENCLCYGKPGIGEASACGGLQATKWTDPGICSANTAAKTVQHDYGAGADEYMVCDSDDDCSGTDVCWRQHGEMDWIVCDTTEAERIYDFLQSKWCDGDQTIDCDGGLACTVGGDCNSGVCTGGFCTEDCGANAPCEFKGGGPIASHQDNRDACSRHARSFDFHDGDGHVLRNNTFVGMDSLASASADDASAFTNFIRHADNGNCNMRCLNDLSQECDGGTNGKLDYVNCDVWAGGTDYWCAPQCNFLNHFYFNNIFDDPNTGSFPQGVLGYFVQFWEPSTTQDGDVEIDYNLYGARTAAPKWTCSAQDDDTQLFGSCSVTTTTDCIDDTDCPGGETCTLTDAWIAQTQCKLAAGHDANSLYELPQYTAYTTAGIDLSPALASSAQVDAGTNATDTSMACAGGLDTECPGNGDITCTGNLCQINLCASTDRTGAAQDANCDIGAFVWVAPNPDPPVPTSFTMYGSGVSGGSVK